MKRCSNCKQTKPTAEFWRDRSRADGLQAYCKSCCIERGREHRRRWNRAHPGFTYGTARKYRRAWIPVLISIFGEIKCQRCGYSEHFAALDFHHIDPSTKERGARYILSLPPTEARIEELRQCQLLCSNCHRGLHHPGDVYTWAEKPAQKEGKHSKQGGTNDDEGRGIQSG